MRANILNGSNYNRISGVQIVDLAPCPFCDCNFVDVRHSIAQCRYYGCCLSCGAMSSWCADFFTAVSAWNRDRPAKTIEENFNNTQHGQHKICPRCVGNGTEGFESEEVEGGCKKCGGVGKLRV